MRPDLSPAQVALRAAALADPTSVVLHLRGALDAAVRLAKAALLDHGRAGDAFVLLAHEVRPDRLLRPAARVFGRDVLASLPPAAPLLAAALGGSPAAGHVWLVAMLPDACVAWQEPLADAPTVNAAGGSA